MMIDWSDPGQGRNGLSAAVCLGAGGLLISWTPTPQELDTSQNRGGEFFIGWLLRICHPQFARCC
jgi:hypothetical protein